LDKINKATLTTGHIPKQLFYLTMPMIAGMLGIVIFNLTDTFFVGRLGEEQLAALSFTFPIVMVINSFSSGIGIGAGALISRYVGEGNQYKVKRLTTDSLVLGVVFILIISAIGLFTIRPLFTMLGARGNVLDYIEDYMSIWYFGSFMVVITMIGNNIIRALGDTKTPGLIMIISATINMILDPLLIFGIWIFPRLEIQGAALTTVFSRGIVTAVAIYVLHFRRRLICFNKVKIREVITSWKEVLHIGLPSASIRLALPVGSGIVTRLLSSEGALVVAGFGVATRIEFFALAPIMALSSVMSPFIGQNLGAGDISRVQNGKKIGQIFSLVIGGFAAILLALFARPLALVFNDNPIVADTVVLYLRIVPIAYGLSGILQISSTILNVFRKPYHASGLMGLQVLIVYIPLAFVGHYFFGQTGVFLSLAISYIIAGYIAQKVVQREICRYGRARDGYPQNLIYPSSASCPQD
jgi:putative MATE family efflux protein